MPLHILLMDGIGTLLFALGVYGLVTGAELPGMEFMELREGAWNYLICGIMLWIPMVVELVKSARRGSGT